MGVDAHDVKVRSLACAADGARRKRAIAAAVQVLALASSGHPDGALDDAAALLITMGVQLDLQETVVLSRPRKRLAKRR